MEKTNKEKMLSGEPFCSLDPDLLVEIRHARKLTRLINATTEDQEEERESLIRQLFGRVGSKVSTIPHLPVISGIISLSVKISLLTTTAPYLTMAASISATTVCWPQKYVSIPSATQRIPNAVLSAWLIVNPYISATM